MVCIMLLSLNGFSVLCRCWMCMLMVCFLIYMLLFYMWLSSCVCE